MLIGLVLSVVLYRDVFCFFFFFQAEDGIRDYKVTGVQTCALPISPASRHASASAAISSGVIGTLGLASFLVAPLMAASMITGVTIARPYDGSLRSEERRVGKECRAWWMT